jgi:hypothetical protein
VRTVEVLFERLPLHVLTMQLKVKDHFTSVGGFTLPFTLLSSYVNNLVESA